jgi:RNA ligase (TIGR02306 family)
MGAEDLGEFHQATAEKLMRALATIARISDLREHPNADTLELATIRGWQVVVKKGEFHQGERVVYCEIDSVLPDDREEFEFLRPRKFRIKTIKLRGEYSQGICFPLSILPKLSPPSEWMDGDDVTDELDIQKYEIPQPAVLAGDAIGVFPSFIPKTDSERIQNHPWILEQYSHIDWIVTEKLDGTSVTFLWDEEENRLRVCSRNLELKEGANVYWRIAKALDLATKLKGMEVALQGEIIGPGIQGNRYQRSELEFYCFDWYDLEKRCYLPFINLVNFCQICQIKTVPHIFTSHLPASIKKLLLMAEDRSVLHNCEREGLVWKPRHELQDARIGRLQFKTISNKFLLKHE